MYIHDIYLHDTWRICKLQDTPNVNEQKIAEEKFREIAVAYQVRLQKKQKSLI